MTTYQHPTYAKIHLQNLKKNINQIKKKTGNEKKILVPVKSNAYGHGIIEVSRYIQEKLDVEYLAVAFIDEAILLRESGIYMPILLMNSCCVSDIPYLYEFQITPTIVEYSILEPLNRYGKKVNKTLPVHINVDTGMGRVGFNVADLKKRMIRPDEFTHLNFEGIYTHLPSADETEKDFSYCQVEQFRNLAREYQTHGYSFRYIHYANSAAIIDFSDLSDCNMIRPGIMVYGLYPSENVDHHFPLFPVMELKSKISFIKSSFPGDTISYGRTYTVKNETKIATIPVGYGDGYNRLLSNQGYVLIDGLRFPVVGRVTMDQIMADLWGHPCMERVKAGDEVVLFGKQGEEAITVEEIAKKIQTIPYEVTCNISHRVPRKYFI